MQIVGDATVAIKWRTAIKAMFFYFNLHLNVIMDSLSFYLHQYPFLLINGGRTN